VGLRDPDCFGDRERCVIVDFDEDALARAFRCCGDDPGLRRGLHVGQFGRTARIVEHLGPLLAVCDAVFENGEHLGSVISADAIAGAEVLINPHINAGVFFHGSRGYWATSLRGGPGEPANRSILMM